MVDVMHECLFHYQARIVRVIDGDTLIVELDTGFHSYRRERLRLLGVNTPEVVGTDRMQGLKAKAFVQLWLEDGDLAAVQWPFIVRTVKTDSFGRYLAVVIRKVDGASLADAIIAAGYGVPA